MSHPAVGALLERHAGARWSFVCSGTMIGCRTFLTAAHCVCRRNAFTRCGTPDPAAYRVYLQHGGILDVAAVDVHPGFVFGTGHDVAVVTVAVPVVGIAPAPISAGAAPGIGTPATIFGVGETARGAGDHGLKREGTVVTGACPPSAPAPAHLCWTFEGIGPPGTDSGACFGDSGGPLLVDAGAGAVVAGVASGISSCAAPARGFHATVTESRAFIESIAGADLASARCGSVAHVGEPGALVTSAELAGVSRAARTCRLAIRKRSADYFRKQLGLLHRCHAKVGRGSLVGPCPDAQTAARVVKGAARLDAAHLARRCTPGAVASTHFGGSCVDAESAADLASCAHATVDEVVAALIETVHGDGLAGAIADRAERRCLVAIGKAMRAYATARLRALAACQTWVDRGRISSCPGDRVATRIAAHAAKVRADVATRCTGSHVASLVLAGRVGAACAGAGTATALADCQLAEHDARTDALLALVENEPVPSRLTVTVPPGTALLRITLNGPSARSRDLDLYAARGAEPTRTSFDVGSVGPGLFEAIEMSDPVSGTWHVLVDQVAGVRTPFQLTVTTFDGGSGGP